MSGDFWYEVLPVQYIDGNQICIDFCLKCHVMRNVFC